VQLARRAGAFLNASFDVFDCCFHLETYGNIKSNGLD